MPYAPGENDPTNPKPYGKPIPLGNDVQAILAQLTAQNVAPADPGPVDWSSYPSTAPTYSGPTGAQMAASEFAPQYAALQDILNNTQTRYDTGKKDVTSMYNQLAGYITDKKTGTSKEYDNTGKSLTNNYSTAMKNAGDVYTKNATDIASILQRLGLGQSAGYVADKTSSKLAQQLGYIAGNQNALTGFNTQQKQNELDYLTNQSGNAKLAGANKVSDLTTQFQDAQYQTELKRLGLVAGEAQETNKYNQSIQDSIAKQQQASIDNWFKRQDLNVAWDKEDVAKAGQELDLQKYNTSVDQFNQTNGTNSSNAQLKALDADPYSKLSYYAGTAYNGDNGAANNAVSTIVRTYRDEMGSGTANLATFLRKLTSQTSDPLEQQNLQQLGTIWWQSVGNKPYSGTLA